MVRKKGQPEVSTDTGARNLMIRSLIIICTWIVLVLLGGFGATKAQSTFREGGWEVEGAAPFEVTAELQTGFVGRGASSLVLAVQDTRYTAQDDEFDKRIHDAVDDVISDPRVKTESYVGYTDGGGVEDNFLGKNGDTALTMIGSDLKTSEASAVLPEIQSNLDADFSDTGLNVTLLSADAFWGEINKSSLEGLALAELIALPLIIMVLLYLYRSILATIISLVVTGTAIVMSLGILVVIGQQVALSSFTLNAVTMLGLGVCVDYSLFIVRRFQQELDRGATRRQALETTRKTATHAVIASGLTIAIAMSTLLIVDLMIIRSLALGIVVVILMSLAACVTLLPALLVVSGKRVKAKRFRRNAEVASGQPSRIATIVTTRPLSFLTMGGALLLSLAIPAMQLTTFTPDVRILDEKASVREGYENLAAEFSTGVTAPIQVLVKSDNQLSELSIDQVSKFENELERIEGVSQVTSPIRNLKESGLPEPLQATKPEIREQLPDSQQKALQHYVDGAGHRMILDVVVDDWPSSASAQAVLEDVDSIARGNPIDDATIIIGGESAQGVASNEEIRNALPWVMLGMIAVIGILLAFSFRSILIPLVAVIMNLLSVGATYGIMVLVFQEGWGAELLGYNALGYVQNFVPVLLLALLFSLATDYQVFLISRIKEEWEMGQPPRQAIARGLSITAPLITGAAVLMVVVFGAFSFTGIVPIQQLGFGLAIGILLDATVVRMLLVPAALTLMGKSAWWFPLRNRKEMRTSQLRSTGSTV